MASPRAITGPGRHPPAPWPEVDLGRGTEISVTRGGAGHTGRPEIAGAALPDAGRECRVGAGAGGSGRAPAAAWRWMLPDLTVRARCAAAATSWRARCLPNGPFSGGRRGQQAFALAPDGYIRRTGARRRPSSRRQRRGAGPGPGWELKRQAEGLSEPASAILDSGPPGMGAGRREKPRTACHIPGRYLALPDSLR